MSTELEQAEERIAELAQEIQRLHEHARAEHTYKLGADAATQRYLAQLAEVRQAYQGVVMDNVEQQFILAAHKARIEVLEGQNTRLRVCWYSARKRQQTAFRCFWGQVYSNDRRAEFDRGQHKFEQWLWNEFTSRNKAVNALKDKLRSARRVIHELEGKTDE